jgi:hypothetical protein
MKTAQLLERVLTLTPMMQLAAALQLSAMRGVITPVVLPRMFQRATLQMWIAELLAHALTVMAMMEPAVSRKECAQIFPAQLLLSRSLLVLQCVQQLRALTQNVAERQLSALVMLVVLPRMLSRGTPAIWIAPLLAHVLTRTIKTPSVAS